MTSLRRLARSTALVSLVLAGLAGSALAATPAGGEKFSAVGSYLAGQQALHNLDTTEAAQLLLAAAQASWDDPMLVERAFVALAADNQIDKAAEVGQHLLELDPSSELARLVLGAQAIKQGKFDDAQAILEQLGTDNFTGITGSMLRAWAFTGEGKKDEADELLGQLADSGLEEFLTFPRALMAEVAGDAAEAQDFISQALELDPYVGRVVEAYARIFAEAGKYDEAAKAINAFEVRGYTQALVSDVKEDVLARRSPGKFVDSVQSGAAEMFNSIGVALARDENSDLSLILLNLGLYLNPNSDMLRLVLAQVFDGADKYKRANTLYESVSQNSPLRPTAVIALAQNLDKAGERPEALKRLTEIVSDAPESIEALSALAELQGEDKQFTQAADTYTKAIALVNAKEPSSWRFFYVRGISYERAGEWAKAEPDFLKALELNPNQPQVLNYLGYSWVDRGEHLQEALGMIEKAVQAVPDSGLIIDSLGWAYFKLGRYEEAVSALEAAVQLMPDDPEINDHLGDAYWHVGRKREASFQWRIAASVDTEGRVKERVTGKLANGLDEAPTVQ